MKGWRLSAWTILATLVGLLALALAAGADVIGPF
jgi:hypothetical protein